MSSPQMFRAHALVLTLALLTPAAAFGSAATCDDFADCLAESGGCSEQDLLLGIALGAVDGTTDLLCFVGDPKCTCLQRITDPREETAESAEWTGEVNRIVGQCGGTASGGRSLSGIAFEAAAIVCTPTFEEDVRPVLDAVCGGCHVASSSGGFNFAGGYEDIVNAPSNQTSLDYVEPGKPAESYLFHKVAGTQQSIGGTGDRMPSGGVLPQEEIDKIEAWILGGAQR